MAPGKGMTRLWGRENVADADPVGGEKGGNVTGCARLGGPGCTGSGGLCSATGPALRSWLPRQHPVCDLSPNSRRSLEFSFLSSSALDRQHLGTCLLNKLRASLLHI